MTTKAVARISGFATLLAFFGISTSTFGFRVAFHPPFTRIDQGEATLWLAAAFLLTPAALLLGYGFSPILARLVDAASARLGALTSGERRVTSLALALFAAAIARVGNELILLGYPVTDDEWAARFGGELLARGQALLELPFQLKSFPWLFMYVRGNALTSMDWLGAQLAWTVSALTSSGNWVFAISAALPAPAIAYVLSRRLSPSWGVLGALFFMLSPMAFALSISTHGHLHSRAGLALMLAAFVWGAERKSRTSAVLTGLALGFAMVARPFESLFFAAPLAASEAFEALKEGNERRARFVLTTVSALLPVLVLIAHSHWVTGGWLPPRHSEGHLGNTPTDISLWVKFGSNSAFNLMRLGVWFAGPIGVGLVISGVMTDRFTKLLALGIVSALAIGLFHDNFGIHAVGPIHYSETAVPLTLLAVHGLANVSAWFKRIGLDRRLVIATLATGFALSSVIFSAVHAFALNDSAHIQADLYELIEQQVPAEQRPAVILAPHFGQVWAAVPAYAQRGTWVFEWRRPNPAFTDDIVILHDSPESPDAIAAIRLAFPTRTMLRMVPGKPGEVFELRPIGPL